MVNGWDKTIERYGNAARRVAQVYAGVKSAKAVARALSQSRSQVSASAPSGGSARRLRRIMGRKRQRASSLSTMTSSSRRRLNRLLPMSARSRRYVTTGKIGPRFPKPSLAKYDRFVKQGFVIKNEQGGLIEGQECVYIGHYSLPLDRTLSACCYALARRIMEQNNLYSQDPLEPSNYSNSLTVFAHYRAAVGGVLDTASVGTVCAANFSVVTLGDAIGAEIATKITSTLSYFELVKLIILDSSSENWCTVQGGNISFQVIGNSNLQIQNRTLASDVTTEPTRFNANDVTNNPLRGKVYTGVCNVHALKYIENLGTPGSIAQFYYANDSGVLAINSQDASFATNVQRSLKKPPIPSSMTNSLGSKYVQLSPGEIRRSNVKSSFRMGFNKLIMVYLAALRGSTNFFDARNCAIAKGKNLMYGLEKMCDTGATTEAAGISVGYECVSTVSAVCYIRKRVNMNAFILPV